MTREWQRLTEICFAGTMGVNFVQRGRETEQSCELRCRIRENFYDGGLSWGIQGAFVCLNFYHDKRISQILINFIIFIHPRSQNLINFNIQKIFNRIFLKTTVNKRLLNL